MYRNISRTDFNVTGKLQNAPRPRWIVKDEVDSPDYYVKREYHRIKNHCLFKYTLKGTGMYYDGKNDYTVGEERGFLCITDEPDTAYYYPKDAKEKWRFVYIAFFADKEMAREITHKLGPVFSISREEPVMKKILGYVNNTRKSVEEITGIEAYTFITSFINTLMTCSSGKKQTSGEVLVNKAQKVILENIESQINVAEVAEQIDITQEHLTRSFRQIKNITPLQYILQQRMYYAGTLLEEEASLNIKEIAHKLGFDNSSHFARTFKRATGVTPLEFRKRGWTVL
jgi:AraC-like DNA-binding protein